MIKTLVLLLVLAVPVAAQEPIQKDWRVWTGIGLSAGAVFTDQQTSRGAEQRGGFETNKFLRDENGHLNKGKQWGVWAVANAALIPCDLKPRCRWISFGARMGLAFFWFKEAHHNTGVGR